MEDCSSCPVDCGVCTTPPADDGGNGGGNGGGGGSDTPPPACVPNCLDKTCGDDGCDGSCGICEDDIIDDNIIIDVNIPGEGNDTVGDSGEIIKPKNLLLNFITGLSFIYRLIWIILIIILIIIIIYLIERKRGKSRSKERKMVFELAHTIKRERNRFPTKKVRKK